MRLLILLVLFCTTTAFAGDEKSGITVGDRFPTLTLRDTQGRAVTIGDSLNGRPLLITVGATW